MEGRSAFHSAATAAAAAAAAAAPSIAVAPMQHRHHNLVQEDSSPDYLIKAEECLRDEEVRCGGDSGGGGTDLRKQLACACTPAAGGTRSPRGAQRKSMLAARPSHLPSLPCPAPGARQLVPPRLHQAQAAQRGGMTVAVSPAAGLQALQFGRRNYAERRGNSHAGQQKCAKIRPVKWGGSPPGAVVPLFCKCLCFLCLFCFIEVTASCSKRRGSLWPACAVDL